MEKENINKGQGGDFRYDTGNTKVPWHAVGEFFGKEDVLEAVKFLMPPAAEKSGYAAALNEIGRALEKLAGKAGSATKLSLGKKVDKVEELAKSYFGVKHALFTNTWTAGMEIAYKLAGIKAGDEIITTPATFIATIVYPMSVGAKIVFADVDENFNLDANDVERKITDKTKMIVPVHIGGIPCDMGKIMKLAKKYDLYVMEDAAHAFGSVYKGRKVGTIGHFGGFSTHEVKNFNSFGEGGLLLSNLDCGEQFKRGRFLGLDFSRTIENWLYDVTPLYDRYGIPQVPNNSSVTEIQALGFILQFGRIEKIIAARKAAAEYMNRRLSEETGIIPAPMDDKDIQYSHHLYPLRIDPEIIGADIRQLRIKLKEKGLTEVCHFGPLYQFRIMKDFGYDAQAIAASCPNMEDLFYHRITHLPLYPLTREQIEYQAETVLEAVRELKKRKK
jgi:perosamine synthetase